MKKCLDVIDEIIHTRNNDRTTPIDVYIIIISANEGFNNPTAEKLTISDFNTLTPLTNRSLPDEEQ